MAGEKMSFQMEILFKGITCSDSHKEKENIFGKMV